MSNQFPRDVQDFLVNYRGPYPLNQLKRARDTLIYGFNTYSSQTFHRLYRIMYMENVSRESNWEYSEDDYSESESEVEPVINTKLLAKAVGKSQIHPDLCMQQGTVVKSKAEPSKSQTPPDLCMQQGAVVKSKAEPSKSQTPPDLCMQQGAVVKSKAEPSKSQTPPDLCMQQGAVVKSKAEPSKSQTPPDLCMQQGTVVKSKAEPSKSEVRPECQAETSNNKPFISLSGFRNRFAEELIGKEAVDVYKKKALEKSLFDADVRKGKRKSVDDLIVNFSNGEGAKNGNTDDDYCHLNPKKAKRTVSDPSASEKNVEGFKCDYCNFTSLDCDACYLHLERAQHQFASRCLGELENEKFSAHYVVKERCLQSDQKHCTKVATCPKCFAVFTDIYACSSHSSLCPVKSNSNSNGSYAISDVIRDINILIPVDSVCQRCNLRCTKHRALNLHYEACKHYPYDKPISPDILISFICPYCKKDFDNFLAAKAHVITHAVKQPRVSMALQLIYYKKTLISHKPLPQSQLPVKSQIAVKSTKRKRNMKRYFE